jgi:glycogen debranching enzyme
MMTKEYNQAIKVLEQCSRKIGFYASGLPGGYEGLWARDSMVTSLGACLTGRKFKTAFQRSLDTLSKNQSKNGQIPNAVGIYDTDRRSEVTFNSIDSTLWYLVGQYAYSKAYKDYTLLRKYKRNINKAFLWLSYQDPNEDKLLVQQPTMDWQDAFPHKYGKTINTHALYYAVLRMYKKDDLADRIKAVVNGDIEEYLSLYDKNLGYYLPWVWKNHDGDREQGQWFDSLGNLLAIVSGLATPQISESILNYIEREKINRPYPVKATYPPIKQGDKEWHSYFEKCEAKNPYQYLNAGIWPFIGGFYVAALIKMKQYDKAGKELSLLSKTDFNEWLDGQTGEIKGTPSQGWSAGAYLFALKSLKKKRVPFF